MIIIRTVDLWITHIAPLQHPFLLPFLTWRARTLPQHLLSLSLSFPSEPVVFTKLPVIFQSSFRRTIVRACPPSLNVSRETFTLIRRGRPGGLPMLHVKHRQLSGKRIQTNRLCCARTATSVPGSAVPTITMFHVKHSAGSRFPSALPCFPAVYGSLYLADKLLQRFQFLAQLAALLHLLLHVGHRVHDSGVVAVELLADVVER